MKPLRVRHVVATTGGGPSGALPVTIEPFRSADCKWAFLPPGRFFYISNQDLEPPERLAILRHQHQGITNPLHTMFRNQSKSAGRQERPFVVVVLKRANVQILKL